LGSARPTPPSGDRERLVPDPLGPAAAGNSRGGARLGVLGVAGAVLVLAGTAWGRRSAEGTG
ncbi:EamA family transporter, partial [Streptomyces microflavus]